MSDRGAPAAALAAEIEARPTDEEREPLSDAVVASDPQEQGAGATSSVAQSTHLDESGAQSATVVPSPSGDSEARHGELDHRRSDQHEALADAAGRQLAERITASTTLPPGIKARLAEIASSGGSLEQAVQVLEEALPGVLRLPERDLARPAHPAGEVFFRGDADSISDERAEAIAQGQLKRSGLLRGQRVRVAAD